MRTRGSHLLLLAALLVLGGPLPGLAQGGDAAGAGAGDPALQLERTTRRLKAADVDLGVPESPAFTALGMSPDTVVRPVTVREFATALLNGVDQEGHLQTGAAIDVAPYLVYAGSRVTLADYRRSPVTRVLSRTQTSFATTKGVTDDDRAVRLAVGVHTTLLDTEDPRVQNDALLRCFSEIEVFRPGLLPVSDDPAERAVQEAQLLRERERFERDVLRPAVDACRDDFRRRARWNGTSWVIAAASTWTSPTGQGRDLDGGSAAVWTSLAYGFDSVPGLRDTAQVIAHVRHHADQLALDEDVAGGHERRDQTFAGARLRAGSPSFGLSFEAAYVRTRARGRALDTATRLAFAAERRLTENVWLSVSFGGDAGADPVTSKGLSVMSAFKWAFSRDPTVGWP
jgi:hypothetical protein